MITIIKAGKHTFTQECPECKCVFLYNYSDIKDRVFSCELKCPDCGLIIPCRQHQLPRVNSGVLDNGEFALYKEEYKKLWNLRAKYYKCKLASVVTTE